MSPDGRELRLVLETLTRVDRKLDELKTLTATSQQTAGAVPTPRPAESEEFGREVGRIAGKLDTLETVVGRLDSHEKEAADSVAKAAGAIRREINGYLIVIAGLAGVAVLLSAVAAFR